MTRQILIEFNFGSDKPDIHRVRNFNDALYAMARENEAMSFGLDQIDKITGQKVKVKSARKLRRVSAKIAKLIEEHGFTGVASLAVVSAK